MGVSQCNCERQVPEASFIDLPTKYNERQTKEALIILQSFKFIQRLKEFKVKENHKCLQLSEAINKEYKSPDIKTFITKFKDIFENSKKILIKCDVKKFDAKIFNQSEEDLENIKIGIKEFYLHKIKEDQEFLLELNGFIDSKRISHEEAEKNTSKRESLAINFGNLLKFIDKAKKFDFIDRSSTSSSSGNLIKKVTFKVPLDVAISKIEEEFYKLMDYKNLENNSLMIEYFLQNGAAYPINLRNFISNIFSLKLMYHQLLTCTNNKYIPVNKKRIKNILRKGSKDEDGTNIHVNDKLESLSNRKSKIEKDEENLLNNSNNNKEIHNSIPIMVSQNMSNSNEKIDLRKNVNPNDKTKNVANSIYNSNSNFNLNIQEKLISCESATIDINMNNNIYQPTEKDEELLQNQNRNSNQNLLLPISPNQVKNPLVQSKKTFLNSNYISNPKENQKHKMRIKTLVNSAMIAKDINTKLASQYYNGELCKNKQLYSGHGKLYKVNKKYIYFGTFKMGRKNGLGKFFKIISENEYFYYGGEFTNNKMEGFGNSFHFLKQGKQTIITLREGIFHKNLFINGEQILIQDEDNILYEEYSGNFYHNQYCGKGKLKRKFLKINKNNDNKYEAEYEYEYVGDFSDNLENGIGVAKKNLKLLNYSYKYEGEFVNGLMEGIGIINYEGNYYIESYEGIFEQDKTFCRYGRVKFKSGDEYEGFFENGKKSEVGIYFYKDKKNKGENFFGRFAEDNRDGMGRYNKPMENKVFVGKYIDGEKNGIFNLTYNLHSDLVKENRNNLSRFVNKKSNFSIMKNGLIPIIGENNGVSVKGTKDMKTELIKQMKIYYLFENDEEIDKSDKPLKE